MSLLNMWADCGSKEDVRLMLHQVVKSHAPPPKRLHPPFCYTINSEEHKQEFLRKQTSFIQMIVRTYTNRADSPTVVYLTSSNVSEEQLRREVILKGPIPLREPHISAYVSIFTIRAEGSLFIYVCVRVYLCVMFLHDAHESGFKFFIFLFFF